METLFKSHREAVMFERTVSLWNRLVHGEAPTSLGTDVAVLEQERRVFVRYPIELETTYQHSGDTKAGCWPARIRDISLVGIQLEVERRIGSGELLSVELPAADGATMKALACVIHAREIAAGVWSVGCTFSRELDDEDLRAFGARRQSATRSDPRRWERFTGQVAATYQPVASPEIPPRAAEVSNISPSGVGLIVDELVDNGVLLSVELRSVRGATTRQLLACVVHVRSRPEGSCALGCNFIRSLSEADLEALR
jgi:hypothetical protein